MRDRDITIEFTKKFSIFIYIWNYFYNIVLLFISFIKLDIPEDLTTYINIPVPEELRDPKRYKIINNSSFFIYFIYLL